MWMSPHHRIKRGAIIRFLIHFPIGLFTAFCGYVSWIYGLIFLCGFLLYEVSEDWHLHDQSFIDIRGWLCGFSIGVCVIYCLCDKLIMC